MSSPEGSKEHTIAVNRLDSLKNQLMEIEKNPNIEINDYLMFSKMVNNAFGIIELFPAIRQSEITNAVSASGINYDKNVLLHERKKIEIGKGLEQHLVNMYTRRSFAMTENEDPVAVKEITDWLNNFDKNLKFLMEDKSAKLKFDADNFKFFIQQDGKQPYTFQNLSSGYSAIFYILSLLLMRSEYLKVNPSKLYGVALIDEIDAHLHVSLQRKILPFLSDSFPGIQFIVTTHSPFVLTSVVQTVIYDLSRREQVEDLSKYSIEAVLEGLFDVPSSSNILQNKINDIANQIEEDEIDFDKLRILLAEVEKNIDVLDEESKFFVNKASYILKTRSEKV